MFKYKVELEWDAVNSLMNATLEEDIKGSMDILRTSGQEEYVHPEDITRTAGLLPALFLVYEYYAGSDAAEELKKSLNYHPLLGVEVVSCDEETGEMELNLDKKGRQYLIERGFNAVLTEALDRLKDERETREGTV